MHRVTASSGTKLHRNSVGAIMTPHKSKVSGIVKAIAGEYKADEIEAPSGDLTIGEKILWGCFVFGILGLFSFFALFSSGCGGWGLYAFLIPFYATFPWIVLGKSALTLLAIYAIGMPLAKIIISRTKWGKSKMMEWKNSSTTGRSSGGGWGGSSLGGGSWSSGGSSFSGGGGSFGGGGSSGGW